MMISTKGRYALRFLVDLAEHQRDGFVPLKEVSVHLAAMRRKDGGYQLNCLFGR